MTHAWMNVLAAIAISLQTGAVQLQAFPDTPLKLETIDVGSAEEVEPSPNWHGSNFIVVERLSDELAYLETPRGQLVVPASYLPEYVAEGMVIEFRIATEERDRRLEAGRRRIERLKQMSAAQTEP